ncbi:MAG TPA: hypothetical protein VIC05_09620 [Solirubrobacteraceae bacterium]|jgi:hypothetical protein
MRRMLVLPLTVACALGVAFPAARSGAERLRTGFLTAPTDQIAVPGLLPAAEITPEGDLYTGWAEYELRFGRRLQAWNQPTRIQPDPSLPLLSSTLADGRVLYRQTVFAVAVADQPVAYETVSATNRSSRPAWARVELSLAYTRGRQIRGVHGTKTGAFRYERPLAAGYQGAYQQPGQAFSRAFSYRQAGRDLIRSGLLLARGPDADGRTLPAGNSTGLTSVHDERIFSRRLRAHARASWTWQIPLDPQPAGTHWDQALDGMPLQEAYAELVGTWQRQQTTLMKISVPEPRVKAAFQAAVTEILCSRYQTPAGWVQTPNRLQYQAYWIRDSAIETQALDLVGLRDQAAQNLAYMDAFQQPNGLFISQVGQYDGWGQALWALDQHARLTQDPAYAAAQLTRIGAAVSWLAASTALDPMGLLPASNPRDDELSFGHVTGDDLWAAAGLRSAVNDALLAGRADLASSWQAVQSNFEGSLRSAVAPALAQRGHVPPVLDKPGAQDWGNYNLAFPVQIFNPASGAVRSTVAWARRHMVEGLATYMHGRWLHDYLGFSIYETELELGETQAAIAGLYSELAHTTATDSGWETDIAPFSERPSATNLAPHGTFAANYLVLLRNMLVSERHGGVDLLAGASPAWLAPGQHIKVARAPTADGVVSFTERSFPGRETLIWQTGLRSGTPLYWVLPYWASGARTTSGRTLGPAVRLPTRAGSLTLLLGGHRPAQSYQRTVAALNASYRARGLRAALAPVLAPAA